MEVRLGVVRKGQGSTWVCQTVEIVLRRGLDFEGKETKRKPTSLGAL